MDSYDRFYNTKSFMHAYICKVGHPLKPITLLPPAENIKNSKIHVIKFKQMVASYHLLFVTNM